MHSTLSAVDKHAIVKSQGTRDETARMFDQAFGAAQALFKYVNRIDEP